MLETELDRAVKAELRALLEAMEAGNEPGNGPLAHVVRRLVEEQRRP